MHLENHSLERGCTIKLRVLPREKKIAEIHVTSNIVEVGNVILFFNKVVYRKRVNRIVVMLERK